MKPFLTKFHVGTIRETRVEIVMNLSDALSRNDYTAHDIHTCFSWISGTTLFNRIRLGKIPTVGKRKKDATTGIPYKFSFVGIVHAGVDDEIYALGGGDKRVTVEYELRVPPRGSGRRSTYEDNPSLDRILQFYVQREFRVEIAITIEHERLAGDKTLRLKRANRSFLLTLHDMGDREEAATKIHLAPNQCFASAVVSVWRIFNYTCWKLGIEH